MPRAIDDEALESPNMQILDLNNPPTKQIEYHPFPKMVYLHPKDKTKEHRSKIVNDAIELEAAENLGWKKEPHIQTEKVEDLSEHFEAAEHQTEKRGPGRPAKVA